MFVPRTVGEIGKDNETAFTLTYISRSYATSTPAIINPLAMPGQVLYPRTVRARIFILPITCSVGLFVQGTSGLPIKHAETGPILGQTEDQEAQIDPRESIHCPTRPIDWAEIGATRPPGACHPRWANRAGSGVLPPPPQSTPAAGFLSVHAAPTHPAPHMKLANLLFQLQGIGHLLVAGQIIGHDHTHPQALHQRFQKFLHRLRVFLIHIAHRHRLVPSPYPPPPEPAGSCPSRAHTPHPPQAPAPVSNTALVPTALPAAAHPARYSSGSS